MSKSTGNYIGIAEDPSSQFGKAMSISDETMIKWLPYVTRWTPAQVRQTIADAEGGRTHPMELKKRVAREIVSTYHGDAAAEQAQAQFEQVHQRRERPSDMAEVRVPGPVGLIDFLVERGIAKSRSDARRLIDGRGVRIDDVVVDDQAAVIDRQCMVQVGKRHFFSVQLA
jgi:tyrosyl-tRNA synthetase